MPSDAGRESDTKYWTLSKMKRAYLDYVGTKRDEITEQQNSRQYRHGAHWTTTQVEIFNLRKQPVVTYNRVGRKIDSIVGLMGKLKQDPKAYPRNPNQTSETAAELATTTVRYVVDSELRENNFPLAIEQGATDGIGGIEMILVSGDKGDPDVGFARIHSDNFFYDPRSFELDFSDARYMGQGKWLDIDDAKSLVPEKAEAIQAAVQSGSDLSSNPDRERRWFQDTGVYKNIRVVEIWYKLGDGWAWCIFTGSMKLAEGDGYFKDSKGKQFCKYIMFSAFIDHDGDRYGFVRNLRSAQDEINQRRSKGLHELNSRRIKAEDGAFPDIEKTRREAVRPDGVVIYNKGFEMEFDDAARTANVEGQLKFLEDAKNEIENFGPNPALIGQGLEYKSGRAINLLQQAGFAELGPFVLSVRNWKLRTYRAIWCAAQQYWQAERWLRVSDDLGVAHAVQVNGVGLDPATGLPRLINSLGALDVNFILDEGPDEVNQMADAYDTLIAMSAQGAKIPPAILIELAPIQASVKRKLSAILEQPDPTQEQAKQLSLQDATATIGKTQAQADLARAQGMLAQAQAQETAQGGLHGTIERAMDAQMAQDQHQMKQMELAAKVQAERVKGQIDASNEFMKLRSEQTRAHLDLQTTALKGALDLRHAQELHQQKMRQGAQPNGGG
jgi:hypothetical protein